MKKHEALEKVQKGHGEYIFAYQQNSVCTKYYVMTIEQIIDAVKSKPHQAKWHELIFFDRPCKLYVDCEKNIYTKAEYDEYCNPEFIHNYVRHMETKLNINAPRVILTACRAKKFSIHVIWNVWLSSPPAALFLLHDLIEEKYMGVTLDPQVYPGRLSKTFRMAYNLKYDAQNSYLYPLDAPTRLFDDEIFKNSIVSVKSDDGPQNFINVTLPPLQVLPNINIKGSKTNIFGHKNQDERSIQLLVEYFQTFNPASIPSGVQLYDDGKISFEMNVFCESLQGWHKSNNHYINIYPDGSITKTCTDHECSRKPFTFGFRIHQLFY